MSLWRGTICENCRKREDCEYRKEYLAKDQDAIVMGCSACDQKQTNADRIRAMTDDGLAEFVWGVETEGRAYGPRGKAAWLSWLKSPVEVEHG